MTITNPPSASSQIELGKSHYLIRSLYQAPSLGGELAFGLKYASIDKDVLLCGHTYEHVTSVHRSYTSSLIWIECIEKKHMEHHLITHISTLTSKPNLSYIKVCRAPPPVWNQWERGCVCFCVCVCQDFPEFISDCAEQMAHCDTVEWFYRALCGATVTVTNCAYRPPLDKDHITDGLRAGARRVRRRS